MTGEASKLSFEAVHMFFSWLQNHDNANTLVAYWSKVDFAKNLFSYKQSKDTSK